MAAIEAAGGEPFEVEVLTGAGNIGRLAGQARRWRPRLVVTADTSRLQELRDALAGLRDLGTDEAILVPTTLDPDEIDRLADLVG